MTGNTAGAIACQLIFPLDSIMVVKFKGNLVLMGLLVLEKLFESHCKNSCCLKRAAIAFDLRTLSLDKINLLQLFARSL